MAAALVQFEPDIRRQLVRRRDYRFGHERVVSRLDDERRRRDAAEEAPAAAQRIVLGGIGEAIDGGGQGIVQRLEVPGVERRRIESAGEQFPATSRGAFQAAQ